MYAELWSKWRVFESGGQTATAAWLLLWGIQVVIQGCVLIVKGTFLYVAEASSLWNTTRASLLQRCYTPQLLSP